jgi:predicted nucleic acid-binding protein
MTAAEAYFVDTNVLLTACAPARQFHRQALEVFNIWPFRGVTLYISGQIVREFLVAASRPVEKNGLGLSVPDALANIRAMLSRSRLLEENATVVAELLELVHLAGTAGKRVHDQNIIATMKAHRVRHLLTENAQHFVSADDLEVVTLAQY